MELTTGFANSIYGPSPWVLAIRTFPLLFTRNGVFAIKNEDDIFRYSLLDLSIAVTLVYILVSTIIRMFAVDRQGRRDLSVTQDRLDVTLRPGCQYLLTLSSCYRAV